MKESSHSLRMRRNPTQMRSQKRVDRILKAAETLFMEKGYSATTTNAIATQASVSIGSLYQFFPDKAAILLAIATQYGDLLQQKLAAVDTQRTEPISTYAENLIDTTNNFFADHPGYQAIFIEAQGIEPEYAAIESACDNQVIRGLSSTLAARSSKLTEEDCDAIAFVLVKAIGTLLWLSLSQPIQFRERLVRETKQMMQSYLQSYFE